MAAAGSRAEVVFEGVDFGEGPRWRDGRLWFSDFFQHAVRALDPVTDAAEVVATVPGRPSGLGWLPDGRLLVVSMTDRRLLRQEPDGALVEHADLSGVATFHTNDMVVDAVGRAYVGNFGFDLDAGGPMTTAALALVQPDGTVEVAADDLSFPNGAVITPDGRTLILAETLASRLTAFTIDADGRLSDRRHWADAPGAFPDGICLDADGAVWYADPGAPRAVRVTEGGTPDAEVTTTQPCFACALGGPDGHDLYLLTAPSSHHDVVAGAGAGRVERALVAIPAA
jgi:sugar lactone lactonase YvrE